MTTNVRKGVAGFIVKHGFHDHPLYTVWHEMNRRCYKESSIGYENYGGRGIRVWLFWRYHPRLFISWALTHGWKPGLFIDRRDNDRGYLPGNCRFVTRKQNQNNRRNNIVVTIKGEQMTLAQAAEKYGKAKYRTIYMRFTKYGWSLADALATP